MNDPPDLLAPRLSCCGRLLRVRRKSLASAEAVLKDRRRLGMLAR